MDVRVILNRVRASASRSPVELLADTVEILSVLEESALAPAPGSPADDELRAAEDHAAGEGIWGRQAVPLAYEVAMISCTAALEQGRAMVTLMEAGSSPVAPVVVLARSLVETANQAWWLLDPQIGFIDRVRRLQALRWRSALEGERAAEADGASPDQYASYTDTLANVERDSRELGLEIPERAAHGVYVCGTQRLPTPSCRVPQMFAAVDVPSVYNLFSGFTHGELFALRRVFEPADIEGYAIRRKATSDEELFKGAVAVAVYALNETTYRLAAMFGHINQTA